MSGETQGCIDLIFCKILCFFKIVPECIKNRFGSCSGYIITADSKCVAACRNVDTELLFNLFEMCVVFPKKERDQRIVIKRQGKLRLWSVRYDCASLFMTIFHFSTKSGGFGNNFNGLDLSGNRGSEAFCHAHIDDFTQ